MPHMEIWFTRVVGSIKHDDQIYDKYDEQIYDDFLTQIYNKYDDQYQ